MELGQKSPEPGMPVTPSGSKELKISYPSFKLNDEAAKSFQEECPDCKIGETLTATVKLKVTSLRKDQYGHSIGFDMISLDPDEDNYDDKSGDKSSDENADEEKVLGYKRTAATPKNEVPSTSVKTLTD